MLRPAVNLKAISSRDVIFDHIQQIYVKAILTQETSGYVIYNTKPTNASLLGREVINMRV